MGLEKKCFILNLDEINEKVFSIEKAFLEEKKVVENSLESE